MAEGNNQEQADAPPEVAALPCRLADVVGEDHAKFAASVSGKDVNDIWLVHPNLSNLQELMGYGHAPPGPLVIRAYVRTEMRQDVFSTAHIEGVDWNSIFPIYAECLLQYHAALRKIEGDGQGKKLQQSTKTLLKSSS